ncbi:MAG: hypothetical protein K0Q51_884 [Rickettsiaceae bacterium]|jgi:hypothetical protein|nr:hypothetical protein [Rickettsiaceae bacterium]
MDKYVTRNKKLLKEAFEHAYEFIYNGKNINIVNEKESPNPISLKDLFILKLHKNEILKALKVKRI